MAISPVEIGRRYRERHPDRNKEACRKWREANREAYRESQKKHAKKYPAKFAKKEADRRAIKTKQVLQLSDEDNQKIKALHVCARILEHYNDGVKLHVDHIIPLKGKTVCGLHIYENMRIIPGIENIIKSNKLNEELL